MTEIQDIFENSFYTDQASKDEFSAKSRTINNAFWIYFLGLTGLFVNNPKNAVLVQYFKNDKSLRNVTDDNNDLPVLVKMLVDKGQIRPEIGVRITKLMSLFKQGKIDKVDESQFRDLVKDVRIHKVMPNPKIHKVMKDFRDGAITLSQVVLPLYMFARKQKICDEFTTIVRRTQQNGTQVTQNVDPVDTTTTNSGIAVNDGTTVNSSTTSASDVDTKLLTSAATSWDCFEPTSNFQSPRDCYLLVCQIYNESRIDIIKKLRALKIDKDIQRISEIGWLYYSGQKQFTSANKEDIDHWSNLAKPIIPSDSTVTTPHFVNFYSITKCRQFLESYMEHYFVATGEHLSHILSLVYDDGSTLYTTWTGSPVQIKMREVIMSLCAQQGVSHFLRILFVSTTLTSEVSSMKFAGERVRPRFFRTIVVCDRLMDIITPSEIKAIPSSFGLYSDTSRNELVSILFNEMDQNNQRYRNKFIEAGVLSTFATMTSADQRFKLQLQQKMSMSKLQDLFSVSQHWPTEMTVDDKQKFKVLDNIMKTQGGFDAVMKAANITMEDMKGAQIVQMRLIRMAIACEWIEYPLQKSMIHTGAYTEGSYISNYTTKSEEAYSRIAELYKNKSADELIDLIEVMWPLFRESYMGLSGNMLEGLTSKIITKAPDKVKDFYVNKIITTQPKRGPQIVLDSPEVFGLDFLANSRILLEAADVHQMLYAINTTKQDINLTAHEIERKFVPEQSADKNYMDGLTDLFRDLKNGRLNLPQDKINALTRGLLSHASEMIDKGHNIFNIYSYFAEFDNLDARSKEIISKGAEVTARRLVEENLITDTYYLSRQFKVQGKFVTMVWNTMDSDQKITVAKKVKDDIYQYAFVRNGGSTLDGRRLEMVKFITSVGTVEDRTHAIKELAATLGQMRTTKKFVESSEFNELVIAISGDPLMSSHLDGIIADLCPSQHRRTQLTKSIKNNLLIGPVMESIQGSDAPIKPIKKLDSNQLVKMLSYNQFDFKNAPKKLKNETYPQYFDRIKTADLTSSLAPLAVKKVEGETSIDMEKRTVEFSKFSNGRHGNIGVEFLETFDVDLHFPEHDAWVEEHPAPMIIPAFHGTGTIAATMILRYGFAVVSSSDASVTGRMLGDGIYFSNVIDKSSQYIGDSGYGRRYGTIGYLLEMDAYIGKEGVDYSAAGLKGDNIRSPEWCVFNARAQLKIRRAHKVKLVPRSYISELRGRHPDVLTEGKYFERYNGLLTEELSRVRNAITYTFYEGLIPDPKNDKKLLDFEEWEEKYGSDNLVISPSQNGPMLTVYTKADVHGFIRVPYVDEFIHEDPEGLYSQFMALVEEYV